MEGGHGSPFKGGSMPAFTNVKIYKIISDRMGDMC